MWIRLSPDNRWVIMANLIPWSELARSLAEETSAGSLVNLSQNMPKFFPTRISLQLLLSAGYAWVAQSYRIKLLRISMTTEIMETKNSSHQQKTSTRRKIKRNFTSGKIIHQ